MSPYISLSADRQKLDPSAMRFVASRLRRGVSAEGEPVGDFRYGNAVSMSDKAPARSSVIVKTATTSNRRKGVQWTVVDLCVN